MGSRFPPAQDLWHAQYRNKHGGILPRKEDWAKQMWLIAYDSHRQHVCEEEDASWSREGVGSSLFHGADAVEAVLDDGFKEIKETGRMYVRTLCVRSRVSLRLSS